MALRGLGVSLFTVKDTLSISEVGRNPSAAVRLAAKNGSVPVCKNGRTVAVLMSKARLEAIMDQIEILSNPKAMAAIRRAKAGKGSDHPLSILDED